MLDPVHTAQDDGYAGHSQHQHQQGPQQSQPPWDDWAAWWHMANMTMWNAQYQAAAMAYMEQMQQEQQPHQQAETPPVDHEKPSGQPEDWPAPLKIESLTLSRQASLDPTLKLSRQGSLDPTLKLSRQGSLDPFGASVDDVAVPEPPPGLELIRLAEEQDDFQEDEERDYGLGLPTAAGPSGMGSPLLVALPAPPILLPDDALHEPGPTPTGMGVSVEAAADGEQVIVWTAHCKFLNTRDKSVVSPEFTLEIPGSGPHPFRIVLYPATSGAGKGAGSFKKAKGKGRIELKCEAQLQQFSSTVWFGVGRDDLQQQFRGPQLHDFGDRNTCGLPCGVEVWDFSAAVDPTNLLAVSIRLAAN
jgi:hypothetical protein